MSELYPFRHVCYQTVTKIDFCYNVPLTVHKSKSLLYYTAICLLVSLLELRLYQLSTSPAIDGSPVHNQRNLGIHLIILTPSGVKRRPRIVFQKTDKTGLFPIGNLFGAWIEAQSYKTPSPYIVLLTLNFPTLSNISLNYIPFNKSPSHLQHILNNDFSQYVV